MGGIAGRRGEALLRRRGGGVGAGGGGVRPGASLGRRAETREHYAPFVISSRIWAEAVSVA